MIASYKSFRRRVLWWPSWLRPNLATVQKAVEVFDVVNEESATDLDRWNPSIVCQIDKRSSRDTAILRRYRGLDCAGCELLNLDFALILHTVLLWCIRFDFLLSGAMDTRRGEFVNVAHK